MFFADTIPAKGRVNTEPANASQPAMRNFSARFGGESHNTDISIARAKPAPVKLAGACNTARDISASVPVKFDLRFAAKVDELRRDFDDARSGRGGTQLCCSPAAVTQIFLVFPPKFPPSSCQNFTTRLE